MKDPLAALLQTLLKSYPDLQVDVPEFVVSEEDVLRARKKLCWIDTHRIPHDPTAPVLFRYPWEQQRFRQFINYEVQAGA